MTILLGENVEAPEGFGVYDVPLVKATPETLEGYADIITDFESHQVSVVTCTRIAIGFAIRSRVLNIFPITVFPILLESSSLIYPHALCEGMYTRHSRKRLASSVCVLFARLHATHPPIRMMCAGRDRVLASARVEARRRGHGDRRRDRGGRVPYEVEGVGTHALTWWTLSPLNGGREPPASRASAPTPVLARDVWSA